jgi:hypothetical protein
MVNTAYIQYLIISKSKMFMLAAMFLMKVMRSAGNQRTQQPPLVSHAPHQGFKVG